MTNLEHYTGRLIQLFDLMAEGKGDSDEADKLRDSMDGYADEGNVTPQERELLENLSGDLYQIQGKGVFCKLPDENGSPGFLLKSAKRAELKSLIVEKKWPEVLKLLRFSLNLPDWEVALYRGMAWEGFDPRVACRFYRFAGEAVLDRLC